MKNVLGRLAVALVTLACSWAQAQPYPNRMVTLVVPYPAGGPSDFVARSMQPALSRALGQNVVVENIAGASGSIGAQRVLEKPDGYSLLLGSPNEVVLAPQALAAVKFKPGDFRLVAVAQSVSTVLLTRPTLAPNNIEDLIRSVRAGNPKALNYGTTGTGTLYHLIAEAMRVQASIDMVHIPYKGGGPLLNDLIGGQIDIAFLPGVGGIMQNVETGKLKALGIASSSRNENLPKLAPLGDGGTLKEFHFENWAGLFVPRATPDDVVQKIHAAVHEALRDPAVRKAIESSGGSVGEPWSVAQTDDFYARQTRRYLELVAKIGLKPE